VPLQIEFVNVSGKSTHIDEISRTVIRKHAKLFRSRQRGHQCKSITNWLEVKQQDSVETKHLSPRVMPKMGLRQISSVDPFNTSPIKLEPYIHDLLIHCTYFPFLKLHISRNPIADKHFKIPPQPGNISIL
jgi:hypothetical protein